MSAGNDIASGQAGEVLKQTTLDNADSTTPEHPPGEQSAKVIHAVIGGAYKDLDRTRDATPHPAQFYRLPHLKQRLGVSGSSIWAWVKAGSFPKPIKLSANCTAWDAASIERWAAERIAASQKGGVK